MSDDKKTKSPPTIELTPDDELEEMDPYERRPDDVVADELEENFEEHYDEETKQWVRNWMDVPGGIGKAETSIEDYEAVDDALFEAIKKSSWWYDQSYESGEELSKAPGIWRTDDQVPEEVQDLIAEVIENTNWDWGSFETLTHSEAHELAELLKEKLTQPQGWSVQSVSQDLQREFDLDEEVATSLTADTSHNVLNTAREEAYERREDSEEYVYSWVGPDDHRTTPVCSEIKEEVEDRGGAVSMPTLRHILRQKAVKYEGTSEGGGTPRRVEHWEPHYQCRHTFVREVQTI